MEIKELEARMYFLAGQLEESKITYRNALGEIERANKEQANRQAKEESAKSNQAVPSGESAAV